MLVNPLAETMPVDVLEADFTPGEAKLIERENTEDVVDKCPAQNDAKFYFVKYRSSEDATLTAKLEEAERDVRMYNQVRFDIIEDQRVMKLERSQVVSQLKRLQLAEYMMAINEKREDMGPVQDDLGKLSKTSTTAREEGIVLCSSQEQLNNLLIDEDGVRMDQQAVVSKIKELEEELDIIDNLTTAMGEELHDVTMKRYDAYRMCNGIRKQLGEMNASLYENESLLDTAKELASNQSVQPLANLSNSEYSSSNDFRDAYKSCVLPSLDDRDMNIDGTMKGACLEPVFERQPHNQLETISKVAAKQTEKALSSPQLGSISTHKVKEEIPEDKTPKPRKVKPKEKPDCLENIGESNEIDESNEQPEPNEMEVQKLKELKREEEIAKAMLAKERKRKLAEKAAQKAATKARKEAEKKLKEKEKQARKKADIMEPVVAVEKEPETVTLESKETEVKPNATVLAHTMEKEKVRYRGRTKVPAPVPKAIIKRKRHSILFWITITAVALAFVFLVYIGIEDYMTRMPT